MSYRWKCPHQWLNDKAALWDYTALHNAFLYVTSHMSDDDILELYQPEMIDDGFFESVKGDGDETDS